MFKTFLMNKNYQKTKLDNLDNFYKFKQKFKLYKILRIKIYK